MFPKKTWGFGLIGAIFILVVLASMGAYLVGITGMMTRGTDFSLLSAQANMAAMSGLEYGLYYLSVNDPAANCNNSFAHTLAVNKAAVTVTCNNYSVHTEGTNQYSLYTINAVAEFGTYGGSTYVRREFSSTVVR